MEGGNEAEASKTSGDLKQGCLLEAETRMAGYLRSIEGKNWRIGE